MKRLITLLALIAVAVVSIAADRTATIKTGNTYISPKMSFTTADSIHESDTVYIDITCEQHFPMMQDVTISMDTVTATAGTPNVEIKLYGKCFAGDNYTMIGDSVVYTADVITPMSIRTTTANRYRYFRLEFISDSGDQLSYITNMEFKSWFTGGQLSVTSITDGTASFSSGALTGATTAAFSGLITGTGGITVTGAAVNLNASSNFATNIGTGTTNAAVSIGGGSNTVAVNSSDWDITTAGVITGVGNITSDGDIIATGGDFTGANGNFIDIGEAADGTITLGRDDAGTVTLTSVDNDANAALTVSAGGTGALTIGDAGSTTAITSSDWSIDATGIAANMGTYNGLTIANSIARLVTTATANADSSVAGCILGAADQFVTVTSAAATNVIVLPAASATTVGMVIEGYVGANGFELRVATTQAATVKLNDVTTSVEAAIPATTYFRVACVSATDWILTAIDEKGAVITAIVPDSMAP